MIIVKLLAAWLLLDCFLVAIALIFRPRW